jgi:putative oxidoreductase
MDQTFSTWQPAALTLLRFITALLLFQFGLAKIQEIPVLAYFADMPPLIQAAGWIELFLGILLLIGLSTRVVAFVLSSEMAFAYFIGHMFKTGEPALHPLNDGGSLAIALCVTCLYLATSGGGPLSLDAVIAKKP